MYLVRVVPTHTHAHRATTVLVLTLGSGVDGFTLDPDTGRFLHTHKDIRIPAAGPIYSFNEAHFHDYDEPVRRYLEALKSGSSSVGVRYVLFFSLPGISVAGGLVDTFSYSSLLA